MYTAFSYPRNNALARDKNEMNHKRVTLIKELNLYMYQELTNAVALDIYSVDFGGVMDHLVT